MELTCHYCKKKGHIQPNCHKKKKDEAEANKKGGGGGSTKAANTHVLEDTTSKIEEVDDNNMAVSLCTATKSHWMMDSGATHHITPHHTDYSTYSPIKGTVCLGDKSTVEQIGVGTVIIKSPQGVQITLSNVLHLPTVNMHFMSISTLMDKVQVYTSLKRHVKSPLRSAVLQQATGKDAFTG